MGFSFLTMKEFTTLSRREKLGYLAAATREIEKQEAGVSGQSLFEDGPLLASVDAEDAV
jgi:hypothetical protein